MAICTQRMRLNRYTTKHNRNATDMSMLLNYEELVDLSLCIALIS